MKIYDCFMFYDEDLIADLRFNILDKYVDEFVVVESKFTHSGEKRKLIFDINTKTLKITSLKNNKIKSIINSK